MAEEKYQAQTMVHPGYTPAIVSMTNPKAERFPPVVVLSEADEQYYRAQGYLLAGEGPPVYQFQEYPKWVGDRIVNSAEEEAALAPKAEPKSDDRGALRAEYKALTGKNPFGGWSAEQLAEKIAAAKVPA